MRRRPVGYSEAMLTVRARRLVSLLAAVTALLVAGCAGVTTTPSLHGLGQDRVGAFNVAAPTSTGLSVAGTACLRPGLSVSGPGIVSGFCVAAEGLAPIAGGARAAGEFDFAPRVFGHLADSPLGALAGKLTPSDLQQLINNASASRYFDAATGNINVVQRVQGVLLRITTPSDAMRIISVGPIRAQQVANGVASGRFVPTAMIG